MQEFTSISFFNPSSTYNIFKKFSSSNIFHYQVQFFICLNYFIQLDNNWMSYLFQNMYFSCNSFNIMYINNLIFFKNFYCHLFPSQAMSPNNNLSKSAFPQIPSQFIITYNLSFFLVLLLIMTITFPRTSGCLYCFLFLYL